MEAASQIDAVLAHYGPTCQPRQIEPLGSAGGFSGAKFWRLATPAGTLGLRRWPAEHPSPERLAFIHAVLAHVAGHGFRQLPLPIATRMGPTCISHAGQLWELTPWLAGQADYREHPSPARLQAALQALAQFHVAASSFPHSGPAVAPSPGLTERLAQVRKLLAGGCDEIESCLRNAADWPGLTPRAQLLLSQFRRHAPAVLGQLEAAARIAVPQAPCLRDIWHDHVLFVGDEVSGLVDFGALRIETVAGDLARLLGSLAADDRAAWNAGLAAYQAVRPLSSDERHLVGVFDRSTVLLSGMNWLGWICVERRSFPDRARVLTRLDENLARLEHLSGCVFHHY